MVTASLDLLPTPSGSVTFQVAATPTGWLLIHQDQTNVWLTAVSVSGSRTGDPTPISAGGARAAYLAVNGDRALVAVGTSVQARNLDGSVAGPLVTFSGSRPGMTAQAVVAGPGDGFRVLRAAVVPPSTPDGASESVEVEIAYHDRDGGFESQGPRASIRGYEFEGAIGLGGDLLARYYQLRSIGGGCYACPSGGLARFDAEGRLVGAPPIPVDPGHAAVIKSLSAAGEQVYLSWSLMSTSIDTVGARVSRSSTDIALSIEGREGLTVVATGPRDGLIGRSGLTRRSLQRFDDNDGFSLGRECELTDWPLALHHHGSSVLVLSRSGTAQLVVAP